MADISSQAVWFYLLNLSWHSLGGAGHVEEENISP